MEGDRGVKYRGKERYCSIWPLVLRQSLAILGLAVVAGLLVNMVHPHKLALIGDWSVEARPAPDGVGEVIIITIEEAEALYQNREALFLDARSLEAYRSVHIEGSLSLPWEDFDKRFIEVMESIPPELPIITYCDGESCELSKDLAIALLARGYANVRVLPDGWRVWRESALPVESF